MHRYPLTAAITLAAVLTAAPAWAAPPSHTSSTGHGGGGTSLPSGTGVDVSYPQCRGKLPSGAAFAIVGVNGGLANDYNGCLSTEWTYAVSSAGGTNQARAQSYLNTADPGNTVGDWPSPAQLGAWGSSGTTNPYGGCGYASGSSGPGANTTACAYVYGYDMVAGINASTENIEGDLAAFSSATGGTLTNQPVWLDVETGNSWLSGSSGLAMNIADLNGMVDALRQANSVVQVGVYSTSSQWNTITGTPTTTTTAGNLLGLPDWIPGASTESGAISNCSQPAFTGTGGTVSLTQWTTTIDEDYSCVG